MALVKGTNVGDEALESIFAAILVLDVGVSHHYCENDGAWVDP
jgi:hypothetical protein